MIDRSAVSPSRVRRRAANLPRVTRWNESAGSPSWNTTSPRENVRRRAIESTRVSSSGGTSAKRLHSTLRGYASDPARQSRLTFRPASLYVDRMQEEATQLAGDAAHADPLIGLAAVASLRNLLDTLEQLQVDRAREQGWAWQRIAAAMG